MKKIVGSKDQIKISIVVPVYNVEDYVKKCLDSLIKQTYTNIEIILVDDGSTDSSGAICDDYVKRDRRVQVIHKKNGGLVSARKTGIQLAVGEYTTYVDSDDWVEKTLCDELVKIVHTYQPDFVTYGFKKEYLNFTAERKEVLNEGIYNREQFWMEAEKCIKGNPFFCPVVNIPVWSKLFKTKLLKKYQLEVDDEIRIGEDMAVTFPYMLNSRNIYITKQCLYHYRVRKDSITWNREKKEFQSYLMLAKLMKRIWNKFENIPQYLVYILYYYLIICAPEYCFTEDKKCILFPEININDNIILYGKGVFANNFINSVKQLQLCNIVECIDQSDVFRIKNLPSNSYQYIVIVMTDYSAVKSTLKLLHSLHIEESKLLYIKKENLILENLPENVKNIFIEPST